MRQALIVALAYWALYLIQRFGANSMAERPIVVGPVIGLLLGDVVTGTLIGAQLEVIYLGIVSVGGAQATDTLYATAMAVALAIISKIPIAAAITLAIPLGFIGLFILQVTRIFFAFMCPILDKIAENGNSKRYSIAYIAHIVVGYGFGPLTMFIALLAGANATQSFIKTLPPFIMTGMKAAGGMLPAIGLGVLLSMIWDMKKAIYFLLGFIIVIYLNIPMIGLAVIGVFLMLTDLYRNQETSKLRKLMALGTTVSKKSEEENFFDK
jgi:mannose PTS system EIIC component